MNLLLLSRTSKRRSIFQKKESRRTTACNYVRAWIRFAKKWTPCWQPPFRSELVALVANIEASIDFPEEGIAPDDRLQLRARLDSIRKEMDALLATADQGRILHEGVRVVIYGATNAGKSSLLNRLLGYERVIVSDTHGTTRDTIEELINLRGLPIRLLDTAG